MPPFSVYELSKPDCRNNATALLEFMPASQTAMTGADVFNVSFLVENSSNGMLFALTMWPRMNDSELRRSTTAASLLISATASAGDTATIPLALPRSSEKTSTKKLIMRAVTSKG